MRKIAPPTYRNEFVLEQCVSGIGLQDLRNRINEISGAIVVASSEYSEKACTNTLHTLKPFDGSDNDIILGSVTKKELTKLYSNYLVGKDKPGREIYDQLMIKAPYRRCPFCGLSQATTLDHFLPKTKFPTLSVTATNLVPSCKDCNTGKSASIASFGYEQPLHPYFDREPFHNEQWLYAEIITTEPLSVEFVLKPSSHWSIEDKKRVSSHFKEFNLYQRYSIEATVELASQTYIIDKYIINNDFEGLCADLNDRYLSYKSLYLNSWQTALYQALHLFYYNRYFESESEQFESKLVTCPRCLGKGTLVNSSCDACNGVGMASNLHFLELGDTLFDPVVCECPDGFLNCRICHSTGSIKLEKARSL